MHTISKCDKPRQSGFRSWTRRLCRLNAKVPREIWDSVVYKGKVEVFLIEKWFARNVNLNFCIGTLLCKPQNIVMKREKNTVDCFFCLDYISYRRYKYRNYCNPRKPLRFMLHESLKTRKTILFSSSKQYDHIIKCLGRGEKSCF